MEWNDVSVADRIAMVLFLFAGLAVGLYVGHLLAKLRYCHPPLLGEDEMLIRVPGFPRDDRERRIAAQSWGTLKVPGAESRPEVRQALFLSYANGADGTIIIQHHTGLEEGWHTAAFGWTPSWNEFMRNTARRARRLASAVSS